MKMHKTHKTHKSNDIIKISGAALFLLGLVILTVNMLNMNSYLSEQSLKQGEARLESVSGDMQRTLDKSKTTLLRFAADVEVYLATGADIDEMRSYLKSQSNIFRDQSEGTLINAYICTSEWVVISDSPLPDGYVVTQREWYNDTIISGIDNIHITAPYRDVFTGQMCFTSALLLSDGKTIVALDFNLSRIQDTVERMNREVSGETIIISRNGLVVGYTESDYSGKRLDEVLPEYMGIYNRLLNEESDSLIFTTLLDGVDSTVFCNRSGDWLFVYAVDSAGLHSEANRIMLLNSVPRAALLVLFFMYFMLTRKKLAGSAVYEQSEAAELTPDINAENINESASDLTRFTKDTRNGIMSIMVLTLTVALVFTGIVLVNWGNDRMEREVDSYNYQLERWTVAQLQTLNMFVDTISANPSVLDEYDGAVEYLDAIVRNYPEISAAYIARPGNEHEMTMNNGWVPNADYIVAERQWYIDTEKAENKMSVSSPYLDARTGLYCVTFSRVVYDAKTGDQIGIFALDFYIGNLTNIMETSYSDDGYAFLVDNSNTIVNHPNTDYQATAEKSVTIAGTQYSDIKSSPAIHFIRDYDGRYKACISRTEAVTGFSIIAVKDVLSIYGVVMLCGVIFITLLAVCIVLLYNLIVRMINWQEKTRLALIGEAQRASQADHAKSSFLAQMSHEIRTPINAVLGMNEMILRESKEENILNYASNAYNSGNALLSIINDILDISKIEAGKLEITEAEYDLFSLISDCYHMTADRADKKGLAFEVHCDTSLPSRLRGDMFHIRQTVVNFITNAIKYTDKGKVELNISGEVSDSKLLLRFAVRDTGIGLKPESLEKLFTSFQRFDLERNRSVEGTGLGLSICKQLAELMGGSVRAESVYGEGSAFTCEIPQGIISSEPIGELHLERTADRIKPGARNMFIAPEARILVVDDVEMNLFVFSSFVKGHKMRVDTASSGKKCLELTAENKYDIIFMDHMMPEMDGMETFAKMTEQGLITPDTPVIMLTANAISGMEEKYLSAGFASYLTKPVQSGKLDDMLLRFLPREKMIYQENETKEIMSEVSADETEVGSDHFDMNTGIMYNGGSREIYFTVLRMFASSGGEKLEQIKNLAESESWKDYVTEVHALKSTSLMIGSKQLSEAAKELELAGKAGNYALIKEKNGALLSLYESVIAAGSSLLISEGAVDESPVPRDVDEMQTISAEKLAEYIGLIKEACADYDDDEAARLCGEAGAYSFNGKALAPLLEDVKNAAVDFEYDEAAKKAQAIADELLR